MDLNARVYVNCGQKDGQTDELTAGWTEKRTPISYLAETGVKNKDSNIFNDSLAPKY